MQYICIIIAIDKIVGRGIIFHITGFTETVSNETNIRQKRLCKAWTGRNTLWESEG